MALRASREARTVVQTAVESAPGHRPTAAAARVPVDIPVRALAPRGRPRVRHVERRRFVNRLSLRADFAGYSMLNRVCGSTCQELRSTSARGAGRSLGATSRRGRTQCPHAPAADAARSCWIRHGLRGGNTPGGDLSTSAVDADFEASTGVRRRLVAADHAQLRPVLFRLQARRLPLPRQVLEAGPASSSASLELAALVGAHLAQWRVADDLLDAAA